MSLWLSKQPGLHELHQQDANQRCGWQASCKYLRVLCPPSGLHSEFKNLDLQAWLLYLFPFSRPTRARVAPLGERQISVLCVVPAVLVMSVACLPSLAPASWVIGHCINTQASEVDYEGRCSNTHTGLKATGGCGD